MTFLAKYKEVDPASASFDVVILDIEEELEAFVEDSAGLEESEVPLEMIVQEVVMYLEDTHLFKTHGLMELREQMLRSFAPRTYAEQDCLVADITKSSPCGKLMADAVEKLAWALMAKFKEFNLYTEEGLLPYEMYWKFNDRPVKLGLVLARKKQ